MNPIDRSQQLQKVFEQPYCLMVVEVHSQPDLTTQENHLQKVIALLRHAELKLPFAAVLGSVAVACCLNDWRRITLLLRLEAEDVGLCYLKHSIEQLLNPKQGNLKNQIPVALDAQCLTLFTRENGERPSISLCLFSKGELQGFIGP